MYHVESSDKTNAKKVNPFEEALEPEYDTGELLPLLRFDTFISLSDAPSSTGSIWILLVVANTEITLFCNRQTAGLVIITSGDVKQKYDRKILLTNSSGLLV